MCARVFSRFLRLWITSSVLSWIAAEARNASCGGFLTQFRGHFQSPNYPHHYDDSAVCRWYIFAPKEFAILIEKHSIDIEDDASRSDCPYDYLRYSFGNWKKTFCGKGTVEPILLDTNFVTVILKTDASMSGSGFNISYRFVLPPCSRTYVANEGALEIPEDKSKKTSLLRRKRWCFHSARGNTYQFTFDYFDLVGEPPKCKHMYVKVLEKNEGQMRSHNRLCGKVIPEPVHTRSSSVSLLFLSDRTLEKNGMHLSWKVFGCNEEHTEPFGQLKFPKEGVFTAYPATCKWTMYGNKDQTIELTLKRLNMQRCDVEYLRAYFISQGNHMQLMPKRCAVEPPPPVVGIDNEVRVKMVFPVKDRNTHFRLRFRSVCEILIIANRTGGVGKSYTYPSFYRYESECRWNIYAPKGERLALFVTDLKFTKSKYCATSSLTVHDGTQPTSAAIAVITKEETRAFLSTEDALSLKICGGVIKFVYMSVPSESCTASRNNINEPQSPFANLSPKTQSDAPAAWEEVEPLHT
ncbi:cubilin-like isoform X2 [Ornithodoros turicata]|uniref:cubilin-like isoform X2 n=1 Tax=Ornithodoros turicata TaxID=34597 RepID=UPI003139FD74